MNKGEGHWQTSAGRRPESLFAVRHAYVKEGEQLPCDQRSILHIENEKNGTALHVWWYGLSEDDK